MTRSIVIGDIHGCYYTLMNLLDKVGFDVSSDHLYLLGDVVGKGKHSERVLDFLLTLDKISVTLGNHDLYWMHRYYLGPWGHRPDFDLIESHENKGRWLAFFKKQNFLIETDFGVLVHASVSPKWDIQEARDINDELVLHLRNDTKQFLKNVYTGKPKTSDTLIDRDRLMSNIYILTQCRYYQDGLFSSFAGKPEETEDKPWYSFERKIRKPIIFGHWSALRAREVPGIIPLDGGAVYGGKLMAFIGETGERFSVERDKDDK